MWKNRTFYIGCSMGIWIACLIFVFVLSSQRTSGSESNQVQISSEQIRQFAQKQHLTVMTQKEFDGQQAQVSQLKQQLNALQQSVVNKQTLTSNTMASKVYVAVQPGLTLSEIGDLLNKAGVIDDSNDFVQAAEQVHAFIKAGIYAFPLHADNTTVLNMITN